MFGSNELYTALNITAIKSLLDNDTGTSSGKALYSGPIILNDSVNKSINFYMSGTHNASADVPEFTYICSCRALNYSDSRAIANAIANNLDRQKIGIYWFNVDVLPTLSPADSTDYYNTPVMVLMS